ncbi:MAG: hypothetical protein DMD84_05470 [Candidatus Rokuibacteriota bacterium]|nr:MAG: hypothetical protein DMD84_05470 [Candidatus Rokubacteria bacterium]
MGASADDVNDNQKHERQLQADAKQLDADAARASSTPDGQRRVAERIAKEFKVQTSVVTDLRNRIGGYGQATIALALSQELMKTNKTLSQPAALEQVVALRQARKGWGAIAKELGVKLGHVVSEVKKAEKATDHVAGKLDKADKDKVAKAEKPEKIEKLEKMEKPAKPEKPGR